MTHASDPQAAGTARLRLLATTDLHMRLTGFDYMADRPSEAGSLSQLGPVIRNARAEAQAIGSQTLLFDNGDGLQGTPLGDMAAETADKPHPLMQMFERLGYDAIGLGNHDFDFGLDVLRRVLKQASFPVVCSNLHFDTDPKLPIRTETVLTVAHHAGPIHIGVLSCLPPQTLMWNADILSGLARVDDIVETAAERSRFLRANGCDIVVALAHSGLGGNKAGMHRENVANLVADLPDIDVVIAGHSHHLHASDTLIQAGAGGSDLGVLDLDLERCHNRWHIRHTRGSLRPAEPDSAADLKSIADAAHATARTRLSQVIGHCAAPIHSYFGLFAPDESLRLTAQMQAAGLCAQLPEDKAHLPVLSAVAPSRFGGRSGPHSYTDIPAGDILERHILDLCVFDNALSAAVLTGAQVLDWLEMSAGLFEPVAPGQQKTILDPAFPGHNFDTLHGITYQIDLTQPPRYDTDGSALDPHASRIRAPVWNGRPLDPDQRFVVAMTSYRANGGGNIPALRDIDPLPLPRMQLRDLMRIYVAGHQTASPLADAPHPWTFAPVSQANAIVTTGPGVLGHLTEGAHPNLTLLDRDANGFQRLALSLDATTCQ